MRYTVYAMKLLSGCVNPIRHIGEYGSHHTHILQVCQLLHGDVPQDPVVSLSPWVVLSHLNAVFSCSLNL